MFSAVRLVLPRGPTASLGRRTRDKGGRATGHHGESSDRCRKEPARFSGPIAVISRSCGSYSENASTSLGTTRFARDVGQLGAIAKPVDRGGAHAKSDSDLTNEMRNF